MSSESETFADAHYRADRRALSDREREAAALLFTDGWTIGELTMTMQCSEHALRKALQFEGALRDGNASDQVGEHTQEGR